MIDRIYIPTAKRESNQISYNNLPDILKKKVIMVLRPEDRDLYKYDCEYLIVPEKMVGTWTELAQTRELIHKHAGTIKYAMIDDDIIIKRRNAKYWTGKSNMEKSRRDATPEEILNMYKIVDKWLDEPDIGIVGLSSTEVPPSNKPYQDTTNVNTYVFYDGRMISKVIDEMDITSVRVSEDMLFLYEALSRGINSRKSEEWQFDNRSQVDKNLQDSRIVWKGMFEGKETPVDYFQTKEHYDCMKYIQKKFPHGVKIYEKDGKLKNTKYWKKVYKPLYEKKEVETKTYEKQLRAKNKFPIYIPSKSRADSRLTSKVLEAMQVPYYIIVEKEQYDDYAVVIDRKKILILDKKYQDEYDTCDDLGNTKSKGPGAARNFAWDHSMKNGYEWHWVMDDNIKAFKRYNKNQRIRCDDATPFIVMEDFVLRYKNVAMAGPHYTMFVTNKSADHYPPFSVNCRIYSCNLIRNDVPFRWRGRYNEDTDLSLRMLKSNWCTIQFYAFLQEKITTQAVKGGNTEAFYDKEGTLPKSQMLVQMHPDVTRVKWRYGRWHHLVDYSRFKSTNRLIKKDIEIQEGINNYGMKLTQTG